jgi:hypothetical protein
MTVVLRTLLYCLILAALGAGAYAAYSYHSMTDRVVKLEEKAGQYDDLKQRFDAFSKEVVYRRDLDNTIRANRAQITQALENALHEDPTVGSYLATPLPDGLRKAYHEADQQLVPLPDRH